MIDLIEPTQLLSWEVKTAGLRGQIPAQFTRPYNSLQQEHTFQQASPGGRLGQPEQHGQPLSLLHGALVRLHEPVELGVEGRQRH